MKKKLKQKLLKNIVNFISQKVLLNDHYFFFLLKYKILIFLAFKKLKNGF